MKFRQNLIYLKLEPVWIVCGNGAYDLIYVTGDLHGDTARLKLRAARHIKKGDYLVVCGDFGFIWDGSKKEKSLLKWLSRRRYDILFVDGTHDNLELLDSYPVTEWKGGMVHEISKRVRHLIRGNVYDIDGEKVFAFGGGQSEDADMRAHTGLWWHNEMPSEDDIERARSNLEKHGNKVDYIITHQCGHKIRRLLSTPETDFNVLDVFFEEIREKCGFKRWFFGCYHTNKIIPPSNMALFGSVVPAAREYSQRT